MPRRFDPNTGRFDYYRKATNGTAPGGHTHPPADISPQGTGSLLDADLLDGHTSSYFEVQDADLDALAALTGTGYARRTAPGTWVLETALGANHDHVFHETPTGSGVGPYTLAATPIAGTVLVYVNLLRQRPVGSSPGQNEYTISGNQITFGWDVSGTYICCDYQIATMVDHSHVMGEEIDETGTTVYLESTPIAGTEVLFLNLMRLRRLPAGPPGLNEYTISGNTITLASPGRQSGDYMTADYLT